MTLHCPECKSTKISPIVETSNNGGYAVNNSMTRKTSVSNITLNSTHRNYWMCSNCGSKFRNVQNLQEEITSEKKKVTGFGILSVLIVIMTIVCIAASYIAAFGPVLAILAVVSFGNLLISTKKVSAMSKELIYLKENCFN